MNKLFLITLSIAGTLQNLYAQNQPDVLIINSQYDIPIPADGFVHPKPDSIETSNPEGNEEAKKITYEANFVLQYGGESKLALLLPKVNIWEK